MEVSIKALAIGAGVCIVVGCITTYYLAPQIQKVTETREVTKNHVVTIIKEVTRPDGTKEKDTTVIDKSKKVATEVKAAAQWRTGIGSTLDRVYQLQVERRILGPVWLGLYGNSRSEIGAMVNVEF